MRKEGFPARFRTLMTSRDAVQRGAVNERKRNDKPATAHYQRRAERMKE
ncbi:hypothetical protein FP2506_04160 [Fulvimarina pelagi HTCC2506]|uniref:Uncharacterized protein n=1 Tax=Fulvimarina pelagi HTCC2506 TaxID=314231 RepID=Q0FZ86_9HYPH|nr:hypothetical protein FP2506_04160 [Fulvimarina pelagi HTCC2506]